LGGEFECQGIKPAKLEGEVALIEGQQWHRNHAAWDGDRTSFVAFTNSPYAEVGDEVVAELEQLGFRLPSQEFLRDWRDRFGHAPTLIKAPNVKTHRGRRSSSEPILKGAQTSYKVRGRKQKQEELFPDLLAEIEKRRKDREKGAHYTAEERFGVEFRKELAKASMERIGGTEAEKREFFDSVIAKHPDVYWIDGCPAPTVKSKLIHFNLKPGAVPKARKPIPLSPYDDLRVEFHIEENIAEGKLRRVEPEKGEKLPEWATPVFVVD
jgi:hypothetical protein